MTNRLSRLVLALVLGAGLAAGGFYLGRHTSDAPTASAASAPMAGASSAEPRRVLYWHDPMVPGQRFDKPGKSPFMDMQLVPVYADAGADAVADGAGVRISSAVQQNLGIRLATVRRVALASGFDAIGQVQFDERLSIAVQTRVDGYVERLLVRAPMERVRKGQALATVFAPDWLGPQNELLALVRAGVAPELIEAARDRMRALSIPADLIRQSEERGSAQARFTLTAPTSGVVAELGVREGVAVAAGTTLFRIAGLGKVWATVDVPEAQAVHLVRGQRVKGWLQADPTQTFGGQLAEIIPEVSANTRTLKARFEVDNRSAKLTPGMLLRLQIAGESSARLVLPAEAVIRTGQRAVVIVRTAAGGFEPRDVALGAEHGDDVEVLDGLKEGEQVVASGQFLIDSEARLRSVLGALAAPPAPPASASASASASAVASAPAAGGSAPLTASIVHAADGKVERVEPDAITISHGAVASLQWPPMTMGFGKTDPSAFADIKPGDTVHFEFREGGASGYELSTVQRVPAGARP